MSTPPRRWTRRGFLAAGGVAVLGGAGVAVEQGVVPGRAFVYHRLGLDGSDGDVPAVRPGRLVQGDFVSQASGGRRTRWTLALPPGADGVGLPVAVVLHGRGNDHASAFGPRYLGLDRFLAAFVRRGGTPYAMVSVDGGESYWHPRASGEDAGAMVVEKLLPMLDRRGLDVQRLAFVGWSMGGFGALRLASLLGPDRVVAATAMSPALWHRFEDTAPGAYDDADDFARSTLFGRQRRLDWIRVRVDCGLGDPFCAADQDYVEGFARRPAGGFERGDHDVGYWRRVAPDHVRFVGEAFSARA